MDLVHDFYLAKRPPKSKLHDLKEQLIEKIERSNQVTQEIIDATVIEHEAYKSMRELKTRQ